jgi:hypothetical protein
MIYNKNTITWIIVCVIIMVILFFLYNKSEDFDSKLATEACLNVASVYNAAKLNASTIAINTLESDGFYINGPGKSINAAYPMTATNIATQNLATQNLTLNPGGSMAGDGLFINGPGQNINLAYPMTATNISTQNLTLKPGGSMMGDGFYINGPGKSINVAYPMTTNIPMISAPGVVWDTGSLLRWANTTGCGGLMSKNMPSGTTKSFILNYNPNSDGFAIANVTLLLTGWGSYIMTLSRWVGNLGGEGPWTGSGIFSV